MRDIQTVVDGESGVVVSECNQVEMIERFHQRVICQRQEREAGHPECQHEGTSSRPELERLKLILISDFRLCVFIQVVLAPAERNIDKAPAVGYLFANLKKKIN